MIYIIVFVLSTNGLLESAVAIRDAINTQKLCYLAQKTWLKKNSEFL